MTVHVASVGPGRYGKRPEGLVDLATEASHRALEGVGRRPIDLLAVGSMMAWGPHGPEALLPRLASRLGLDSAHGLRLDSASGTGGMTVHAAVMALETGRFQRALVVAVEKMTDRTTAVITRALAASLDTSEAAAGGTMPALAALVTQRYLQKFQLPPSIADAASVHDRAMAVDNPFAHFQKAVSADEVASSRAVALPLRLLHCSAISDGASALVLERGEGPATVLGLGQAMDAIRLVDRDDLTTFSATRLAGQRAYENAHVTPSQVQVAEVHDAFSPFLFLHAEDLGLVEPGKGSELLAAGGFARDGRIPINPSGGVIGRGHPVAASGVAEIGEVALQLRGEAERRAIATPPRIGLAHAMSGIGAHNFVTILGAPS